MTPRVLVVDDDAGVRYTLRGVLEDAGLAVEEAEDGKRALARMVADNFDLVLCDLRMPGIDGLEVLRRSRELPRPPRLILITAHGSERAAVVAMKHGAYDYFRKPFEPDELMAVVERAVESVQLTADRARLEAELALSRHLVFASEAMRRLAVLVARVAPKDVTVLLEGESGTGKERVADALVAQSGRSDAPFIRFNCAAISSELAEAELFGHAKGAFTGAMRSRRGLFREADGGTLFLDEVAELEPRAQAKLLRVLQEGEVRPVGEDHPVPVDVRILAATHQSLDDAVRDGRFREDLMYRLKVVRLEIPPLRDRREDIPALASHFLRRSGERFGAGPFPLDPALNERLLARDWPGNVRELQNAIESMVALSPPDGLDLTLLDARADEGKTQATLEERLAAYERGVLLAALAEHGGNRTEAARALGIGRATMYEKLRKHGVGRQ